MSQDLSAPELPELPDEVRLRVLSLTADVLGRVPKLPPPLRKVADFAPARRARLGASAIAAALVGDDDFRERAAVQVAARLSGGRDGRTEPGPELDPVETAARSWLTRPEGWEAALTSALGMLAERSEPAEETPPDPAEWQAQVQTAERALRDARTRHRADLTDLKAENAQLRRKLGEERARAKAAVAAAESAEVQLEETRRRAETTTSAHERESRQLRAQVERLEADANTEKRAARVDKDDASLRARLLLDTVLDAAAGLRRELSLPPVAGSPGERIEADLASEGTRPPSSAGALGPSSPALLEQYLALPRARLIVDGYNVSKTAWPSLSLEAQRTRLVNGLAPVVARTGAETTVVFDAASSTNRPVVSTPRGVKVVFSPEGVIADDVIRDLVSAEPEGRVVVVCTDDRALGVATARSGAVWIRSAALASLV